MKTLIIIPVFNEEKNIEKCLKSLLNQTHRISQITVVNDGSNDKTDDILTKISKKYGSVNYVIKNDSLPVAKPGKKIIQAFNYGLKNSISDYELIGKFDADILLPHDYFKIMIQKFKKNQQLGLVSGTIAINKNKKWVVEDIYNKNHVRGGIKLYKKEAFDKIRGLVESIGWDTVDEMNLLYSNYKIKVYHKIICKQLRITGKRYSKSKFINQGRVMYLMGYDILLCLIGSFKFSIKNISLIPFFFSLYGYFSAWSNRDKKIVSNNLSKFVRSYRYKNMFKKVINKDY